MLCSTSLRLNVPLTLETEMFGLSLYLQLLPNSLKVSSAVRRPKWGKAYQGHSFRHTSS